MIGSINPGRVAENFCHANIIGSYLFYQNGFNFYACWSFCNVTGPAFSYQLYQILRPVDHIELGSQPSLDHIFVEIVTIVCIKWSAKGADLPQNQSI
mmetsp:Transcript_186/g.247  ORF Transcript_186/g.247 Transcript_186/m.247 type:complete len:97 (+) Transcript_186:84-374(+)